MSSSEARRAADKRRREREPYRKLFDHIRQGTRLQSPKFSGRMEWLLGYDYETFKAHMISRFEPGMTWEAFVDGDVHIDHIVPLACFDRQSPDGIRQAWALTNIRPAWPHDNLEKLRRDRRMIRQASLATL